MRLGIIGLGEIGRLRAAALLRSKATRLVAAADLAAERLAPLPAEVARHEDAKKLLARADVDAVVVSTPPSSHEDLVLAALAEGKHVLVEKPMAPTAAACRRMVEAANAAHRILACGFNHRYFPAIRVVRDSVRSGRLGRLSHLRGYAGHVGLAEFSAPWMYEADVIGGGTLSDNGIHMLDLVVHLLGEVTSVSGMVSDAVWGLGRSEDNAMALLRGSDGVLATLHSSWTEWKGYRFHLEAYGELGMARAYYAPMSATLITMPRPGGPRRVQRWFYPEIMLREKLKGWQSTVVLTFIEEFADFVRATSGQDGDLVIATGTDGWRAVAIAEAVRHKSAGTFAELPAPP